MKFLDLVRKSDNKINCGSSLKYQYYSREEENSFLIVFNFLIESNGIFDRNKKIKTLFFDMKFSLLLFSFIKDRIINAETTTLCSNAAAQKLNANKGTVESSHPYQGKCQFLSKSV